jgi:hypothetical protein
MNTYVVIKRFTRAGIVLPIALALGAGCSKQSNENPPARQQQQPGQESRETMREPRQPRSETLVIPAGTTVVATLATPLATDRNQAGDAFVATTVEPIQVGGKVVVPSGSRVHGVLRDVQPSGRIKGRARMTLAYERIVDPAGKSYPIDARPLTLQAASTTHGDVEKIAAGGALGAIIGGITGGKKGAAIGAGAGAGAGTVLMLATKGKDVELGVGQRLNIQMTSPVNVVVVAQR